ncbi:hypothetical protein E6R18_33200 [Streptomyces sp. A1277]|uniref:hypothetical protein n=1 Tax=Streptomyces sp. A1277 TaxID=2563103 RepID=UPI0010A26395|nr:hypothetical protein [Streptomyces sp. A1277]THA22694.1 hypothetical protein E6R18_33200 [Streptomyces sp. A1277]
MHAILPAAAVLAAALALGTLLLWRRLLRGRTAMAAYFAATVAGTVLAATAAATPPQQAGPDLPPGTPVLTSLSVGQKQVPVLVVPGRPGTNLVAMSAEDGAAGPAADRLTPGRQRPGSTLTWALVDLPAGRSTLWVSAGGATAGLPVDTGKATAGGAEAGPPAAVSGPDGPECAHYALGRALATDTRTGTESGTGHSGEHPAPATSTFAALPTEPLTSCPSDTLTPADAAALRATVDYLAGRGHHTLALTADSSPRGRAAAAEVRATAARAGLTVTTPNTRNLPLIVVAGWKEADSAIRAVASGRTHAEGTYLAPWLLTAPLLQPSAGQIIPLRYAPRAPEAEDYLSRLGAWLPGETPTGASYTAWRTARGTAAAPLRLYAAATVYVPGTGGATGAHHGATGPDWLPSGMIVPATGPLGSPR